MLLTAGSACVKDMSVYDISLPAFAFTLQIHLSRLNMPPHAGSNGAGHCFGLMAKRPRGTFVSMIYNIICLFQYNDCSIISMWHVQFSSLMSPEPEQ